jgi:nucleoside-diphosphate-sugar epimerase
VKRTLTFLVTGGAGFLGHNLCDYLSRKGCEVRSIDIERHQKTKAYKGDIRDAELVNKLAKGADVVVHAAAALPLWKEKDIFSTNVDGTKRLLEAAARNNVKRFIFVSSTAVYGVPKTHPLYEDSPLSGVGPYGQSKILAEKACEKYRRSMCVTILRPKTFVGRGRLGAFQILFDWLRQGKSIPLIGNGNNRYQLMDVDDLCDAIYLASTKPAQLANDTFNVGSTDFATMKEDFQALVDYAGFGKKVVTLPAWSAILALKVLWALRLSPLYKWVFETADKDSFVAIDKIQKQLGWKPKKSNKQALIDCYKWYLSHYKEYEGTSGITHRTPWKQGILRFVSMFF